MDYNNTNRYFGLNKRILSFLHHAALLAMLHSSFVAPAQGIIDAYIHNKKPAAYFGTSNSTLLNSTNAARHDVQPQLGNEYEMTAAKSKADKAASINLLFDADIKEGIIGISKDKPLDNPSDNLFKVNLDQLPATYDRVYLTYEVFGVADHHSVARSINERLSVGGYLVKKQQVWSEQKEEINPSWLQKGQNTILFTIPAGADYQYKIRNLAVKIEKKGSVNSILALSSHTIEFSKDNKIYVKGFLRGNYPDAKIEANGTFLQVSNNEFEGYVTLSDEIKRNGHLIIKATENNNLLGQEILFIDNAIEADRLFPFERKEESVFKLFKAGTASKLEIDGAAIMASDSALVKDYELSVSRLRNIDVAPMESGMINVTKGGSGYRFLPDGTKFEKPVRLSIAYDSKLIPTGYTEKDIKTYYFDTHGKRWIAVQKDSIDITNNSVISKTTHFTDYINGIIQAPDSPESSAFTPTMMSDIKAADPSAEMTLISPPSASQNGDANISYPIKLPSGRRGMQPQLGLQYSNEGGNSWLGLGWNLSVPALSIDTKWGVPMFDPTGETEIYALNGEQLMYPDGYLPHRHQDVSGGTYVTGWQNRNSNGTKLFFPRKQGSFAKIERLGNTPQTYYWKVTNTDGTVSWYGGKTPADVQAGLAVLKDNDNRIVHWSLFMVEDVYGNNMRYSYETFVNGVTTSNLYQGKQLYLTKINYTGYGNDLGNYDVEFLRKTSRQDVNINARLGIKQVDFHLLEQIKVNYKNKPVRSYFLNYTTGRFNKSLLQSVAERDAAGVEFYKHTFDYYDDIKKSDGTDAYFSAEIEEQICTELPGDTGTDYDHDGVPNSEDECIDVPGTASNNGCPDTLTDTDNDGVPDSQDNCVNTPGTASNNGCPDNTTDTDHDGVPDSQDDCVNTPGPASNNGCPDPSMTDTDQDGVPDSQDGCINTPGPVSNNGCPETADTDNDGVPDSEDGCVTVPGPASNNGCPDPSVADTDNDGVLDSQDQCVDVPGPASNNGCPDASCKQASFSKPSTTIYRYTNNFQGAGSSFPGSTDCHLSFFEVKKYIINGEDYDASLYYIFALHGAGNDPLVSRCPYVNLPLTTTYDYGIENPDGESRLLNFVSNFFNAYNIQPVDTNFSLSGRTCLNSLGYTTNEARIVSSFVSQQDMELKHYLKVWRPAANGFNYTGADILWTFPKLPIYNYGSVVKIYINNSTLPIGTYNLSDASQVNQFSTSLAAAYPGTTMSLSFPPGMNQPIFTFTTSNPTLNTIRLVTNPYPYFDTTYIFMPCVSGRTSSQPVVANAPEVRLPQEAMEYIVKKWQAEGEELLLPIKIAKAFMPYNNDEMYILIEEEGTHTWAYSEDRIIEDKNLIKKLDGLIEMQGDNSLDFEKFKQEEIATRKSNQEKAIAWLEDFNKKHEPKIKVADNSIAKPIRSSFANSSRIFGYPDNYSIDFEATIPIGDPDCPSLLNLDFLLQGNIPSYNSAASMLGSSKTEGYSVGGSLGLGIGCKQWTKNTTFGYQKTFSYDKSGSFTAMIDIDGDGLDDYVFKGYSGSLYYRKHNVERTYENGELKIKHTYNEPETITGITNFYKGNSQSTTDNFQVTFGFSRLGGFAGIDFSNTKSETNVYFTDANGDGLPDIVKNETVFFNRLVNGKPEFIPNSMGTPNLVIKAKPKMVEVPAEYNEGEIKIPDYDVVKVWEVPYEGNVQIINDIVLTDLTQEVVVTIETRIKDFSSGVGCLIYGKALNSSSPEIHEIVTSPSNSAGAGSCMSNGENIYVIPGQLIFFRVHATESGINPKVNWDPKVEYVSPIQGISDQNGLSPDIYQYSHDFLLTQKNSPVIFPGNGTATLTWDDIAVNAPSDDVTFEIYQTEIATNSNSDVENSNSNDQLIYKRFCPSGVTTLVSPSTNDLSGGVISNIAVSSNDSPGSNNSTTAFYFKIKADSNVNWKQIEWKPRVNCITQETVIGVDNTPEGTVTTNETYYGIPDVTIYKVFNVEADDYTYNAATHYSSINTTGLSNVSSGQAVYILPYLNGVFSSGDNGTIKFVVKRNGIVLDKRDIYVSNGSVSFDNSSPIYIDATTNNQLEIGFYTDESRFAQDQLSLLRKLYPTGPYSSINVVRVAAGSWTSGTTWYFTNRDVNLFHIPSVQKFGPMHRQWGQFAYNPSLVENATPSNFGPLIHASYLEIQPNSNQLQAAVGQLESLGENMTEQDLVNFQSQYQDMYSSIPFFPMYPKREAIDNQLSEKWLGTCPQNYASALSYRAAGMDEIRDDYIDPDDYVVQEVLETGAYGINKYNKGKSKNVSGGASLSIGASFGVGASVSKSLDAENNSLTDYIDLNGDRYPDIVTTDKVQYTVRTGGLQADVPSWSRIDGQGGSQIVKSNNSNLGFAASGSYTMGGKSNTNTDGTGCSKPRFIGFKGNSGAGISGNFSNGESTTSRMWADVNGDGLADILEKSPDYINVRLNMGNNVFQPMQVNASSWGLTEMFNSKSHSYGGGLGINKWNGSVELGVSLGGGRNDVENTLVDMNGDGIADVVHSDSNGILVRVNKGNGFVPEIRWSDFKMDYESEVSNSSKNAGATFAFTWPIPFLGICLKLPAINLSGSDYTSTNRTKKSISDFDGDGFPDLIREVSNNTLRVKYSNIRRTNMLKSVQNPLGGSFTVDYDVITPTYNNPNPKWVLKNVVIEDGYDLINDGVDTYSKNFAYENGYYDRREREFYGYETVKTIDNILDGDGEVIGVYRTAVSAFYNTSYYLKGMAKSSYVMKGNDVNQLFSKTINNYVIKKLTSTGLIDLAASNAPLTFDTGGAEGRKAAVVLLESTENYIYELGTTPIVSKVQFTYNDARGRITKYDYKGNIAVASDNYTADITYFPDPALETKNIYTVPGSIVVKDHIGIERRRRTVETIDSGTGAITMIGATISSSELAETLMSYDQYGNLSQISLPPNESGQWFTYTYQYDTDNHKLPISTQDSFGYTSHTSYNLGLDKVTKSTDITGNQVIYTYDTFGRMLTVVAPKEQEASIPYTISFGYYPKFSNLEAAYGCTGSENFMPIAVTSHYDPQHPGNDIQTYTFIDGLGRPVQVKKDIEINYGNAAEPSLKEAVSISGKVFYDQYGRGVEQYHPYYEDKECSVNLRINEYESPYVASTSYDEMDRPKKSVDPEGSLSTMEYSLGNDSSGTPALKTRSVTEQNGSDSIISETFKDINGRVTSTLNVLTGSNATDIVTQFNYNSIGELMSYTDAENISTTYKYDKLGRKIEIVHPDNGTTTYKYDLGSRLTKLQTANLAVDNSLQPADRFIKYYYDYNRLNKIIYPATGGATNISDVGFVYGSSGNETGRVTIQYDATGKQFFQYGNMGEMINNTRIVVGPNIPTRTFTTAFSYDSWNRVNTITYPDGEVLNHEYNLGGNLVKISGDVGGNPYDYIKRIDYDYFEQRTYLLYGNGTDMAYDYTPALRRLNTMVARTSSQQNFLDNTYTYDKVGNVTTLVNAASPNSNNAMGGTFEHQYTYDNLNRLTTGTGGFMGDSSQSANNNDYESSYNLNMTYNTTHGIVEKQQEHNKNGQAVADNTYRNGYEYYGGTHMLSKITDSYTSAEQTYKYDKNGNITDMANSGTGSQKNMYWDESNRLRVLDDQHSMQHYIYDANGERVLKASAQPEQLYNNGVPVDSDLSFDSYTTYPSAYIVVNPDGKFSKHYYAGSQRIVSRVADDDASIFEGSPAPRPAAAANNTAGGDTKVLSEDELRKLQISDLTKILEKAKKGTPVFKKFKPADDEEQTDTQENSNGKERMAQRAPQGALYFYHPDYLGTSTFLTDANGDLYQFFLNLPFGETMAEQHSLTGDYETPYKFNGKELDSETGLYYYGARYYDPRASIWLSTDPLMENFPNINPYVYCYQNPINIIDPTGMAGVGPGEEGGGQAKPGYAKPPSDKAKAVIVFSPAATVAPQKGEKDHNFNSAYVAAMNNENMDVIIANDLTDLNSTLNSGGKVYDNLFILGHGSPGTSSQDIGASNYTGDFISTDAATRKGIKDLGNNVKKGGNIVLLGCFTGSADSGGDRLVQTFANLSGRRVYADQGESYLGSQLFNLKAIGGYFDGGKGTFEQSYKAEATKNAGKWRIGDPGSKQTRSINNIKLNKQGGIFTTNHINFGKKPK
jgi:RHS repeat-associated protein